MSSNDFTIVSVCIKFVLKKDGSIILTETLKTAMSLLQKEKSNLKLLTNNDGTEWLKLQLS